MCALAVIACDVSADDGEEQPTEPSCEATPEGELAWSRLEDADRPVSVVFDPAAEDGGFYVGYASTGAGQTCVTRHAADGATLATIAGAGCGYTAVAADGSLLVAGTRSEDGDDVARVAKLDASGAEQWAVEREGEEGYADGFGVAVAGNGDVMLLGRDGWAADWVLGLTADGEERFVTRLAGRGFEPPPPAFGVSESGYATVAHTVLGDDDLDVLRLHQLDADGKETWTFDIEGEEIRLEALSVDADGRTLVGWYTFDSALTEATRWMSLVDADGTQLWTRNSKDTAIEAANAFAFGPCETIIVAGAGDPGVETLGAERRMWIAALDLDGEPLWSEMIDGPFDDAGDGGDFIQAIAVDGMGNVVAAGEMTVGKHDGGPDVGMVSTYDRWLGRFDF